MVAFIQIHPDVFQRELFSGMCTSAALFKLVRQLLIETCWRGSFWLALSVKLISCLSSADLQQTEASLCTPQQQLRAAKTGPLAVPVICLLTITRLRPLGW